MLYPLLAFTAILPQAQTLTAFTDGYPYGGMMPQTISGNGKYVGGSTFAGMMFLSDWEAGNYLVIDDSYGSAFEDFGSEIRGISNTGKGVGFDDNGAVTVNLATRDYRVILPIDGANNINDAIATSISEDGSIIVGDIIGEGWDSAPVYWEDGEMHYLPLPDETDFGFTPAGYSARLVADGGNIIAGYAIDNFATYPLVIWQRRADGTYVCDPVFKDYFEGGYGTKEFLRFHGMSITRDGTTVVMKLQYNTQDPALLGVNLLGLYTLADKKLRVIHIDGEHGVEPGADCTVWFNGISNDGTVVGWFTSDAGARYPFIMYADELQPILLSRVFPKLEKLREFDENREHALSGISADGRYICGMGQEYVAAYDYYLYTGYVIDTKADDNGENAIETLAPDMKAAPLYFSIDGKPLNGPADKGITIEIDSDGKSRKLVK